MHAGQLAKVGLCNVDIKRLALVNEGSSVCHHVDQSTLGDLPHRLVQLLQVLRNALDFLKKSTDSC